MGDTPYIKKERTHKNDTVAKATGAGLSPAALRTKLYDAGKGVFGPKTGWLVTNLLKHCGGDCDRALDLVFRCQDKTDPLEYANAILRGDAGARVDDVLADTDRLYRDLGVS